MNEKQKAFIKNVATEINKLSLENMSDTPDFVLAEYLWNCLLSYSDAISKRDKFFNVNMWSDKNPKPVL